MAVTDPAIIGAMVDGVVLVVRPSTLKRQDAARVREHLTTLGTPILGAVINMIGREHFQYGFGYGYGYGYGNAQQANGHADPPPTVGSVIPGLHAGSAAGHEAPPENGRASSPGPHGRPH